jgi:hypothetical protein
LSKPKLTRSCRAKEEEVPDTTDSVVIVELRESNSCKKKLAMA